MKRSWLAPLILIILTVAFLLLWESPPQNFLNPQPAIAQAYPSNIVINPVNRRFNQEGRLTSLFTAAETRHFQVNPNQISLNDHTNITQPSMIIYNSQRLPWNLSASHGKTINNGALIELNGNVRLWQQNQLNQISELTTSSMVVEPEQQYAHTDKPVIIRSVNEITRATGMKASLQEDQIQLLSNVRGIYEPQP